MLSGSEPSDSPSTSSRNLRSAGLSSKCNSMARQAVHAAMAGKTDVLIGVEHGEFLHVPICTAVAQKKFLQPNSELWLRLLETTGQPVWG